MTATFESFAVETGEVDRASGIEQRGQTARCGDVVFTAIAVVRNADGIAKFVRYLDPRTAKGRAWCYADTWRSWQGSAQ